MSVDSVDRRAAETIFDCLQAFGAAMRAAKRGKPSGMARAEAA
jgi:hypothetical protein